MRKVHLFDPQLSGQGGHYLNHDAQLIRDLHSRGIAVELYGRTGTAITCEGVAARPTFRHDIFMELASDPAVWAIENFHGVNDAFLFDLQQLPIDLFAADDLIYLPNLLQNQLYAVARWLSSLPADRRPAVAVMLRYLNHAMDYVQARSNKELIALYYRFAARTLSAAHSRVILCADTRELATAYQKITGIPVLELPNPMDVGSLKPPSSSKSPHAGVSPVVVYQGHTSPLRGFHFLPDIIEKCSTLSPPPRFVVQVQNRAGATATGLGPALAKLDRLAGGPHSLRLIDGVLSPEDYFALLAEADIVLLPYTPTFYGVGSSGVFTEAASMGKVIVVSPKTVPARQGVEYGLGVITASQWTPAAMADAVAAAVRDLPALKAKAESAAPHFRSEQCAKVLWNRVFAALPALPGP